MRTDLTRNVLISGASTTAGLDCPVMALGECPQYRRLPCVMPTRGISTAWKLREIKNSGGKLTHTEFVVDPDAGVDFFSRVSAVSKAEFGFEQFDFAQHFFQFRRWLGRCSLF